ncbi:hypothetical protein A9HBioS_3598 [Pseudomonas koreensis]|uniref:Uncharacterized protein n=1 Tax=Pseudomonas koreensis TaxID=198620 RepID=A0AA94ELZ6_9PSED|nr:hypothetical protein A9HBioS_3598 [Pseudomonas koreensis]
MLCLIECISVSSGAAAGGFALTATHFFYKRLKKVSKKNACSYVRPARWGSGSLRSGIDPGAASTVCCAAPPLAVFGFAKRSLRSHARINPSAQPSDVAGGSRAAAELTLILLSGERRMRSAVDFCGSWFASDGGLTADQSAILTCRSCRRLRSFDLAFDCGKPKSKDRSLRQLLQGDVCV